MKKSAIRLFKPEQLYPYSTVAKPLPPPPVQSACEGEITCITLSCAVIPYVLGALEIYRWEDSFTGTSEEKRVAVGVMHEVMREIAMGCGCGDSTTTILHRVDPVTGYPEQSSDGGETWINDPDSIYSQAVKVPPKPILDTSTSRCEAANNVVENLMTLQEKYSGHIGEINNLIDLAITLLVDAVILLLTGLIGAPLVALVSPLIPKILDVARDLLNTTQEDYDALFTIPVWNATRCIVYCNTADDGVYTQAEWLTIINQLKGQLGAGAQTAGANLASMVNVWGIVGLQNASRLGSGAEGNCDDCACSDEWWFEFDFTDSAYNLVWHPFATNQGHYVANEGYAPDVPIDIAQLVIASNFEAQGGVDLIGYIVEQTGTAATNYNRGVFYNETRANLDGNTTEIIDQHDAWAGETDGFLHVTFLAPQWVGPAAGGGSDVRLTRVGLHGKGSNPFGYDNYSYDPMNP